MATHTERVEIDGVDEKPRDAMPSEDARHVKAMARFRLSADADSEQRQRELDDIKFVDFDDQWPADIKAARAAQKGVGKLPSVPARPCLTINKIKPTVKQVTNQARQARLSLSFAPKGHGASREVAEAYEDIARAIQTETRAHLARQWAFDRAVKAGRGFYRILTTYANDDDDDLDLVYARILNQSSVYLDPHAQEPDWSDMQYAFITSDMPWDLYRAAFPDSRMATSGADELTAIGDHQPQWVLDGSPDQTGHQGKVIRIAEYWYVEPRAIRTVLYQLEDGSEKRFAQETAPRTARVVPGADGQPIVRVVEKPVVKFCKINAIEILEEGEWPGALIPIIPVIGDESNADGQRRWTGLVRPGRDPQVSYNVMRSAGVEAIGVAPKAPFIGYIETIEGFEKWWFQANTRNFPILPIRMVVDGTGRPLPPPERNVVEPAIQAIMMAGHEADNDIKAVTGIFDASLGNLNPADRSGKAILALQKQAETGSADYLDNLATLSMIYEGKVLLDLIPKLYNRPGRVVPGMGGDDQRTSMMVGGQPFVMQNGQPQPAAPDRPDAKTLDLAAGKYSVAVTVGKSFTTRREEGAAAMSELASAMPPDMVASFADLWVSHLDFPGAQQIADRLKKQLPPQLQDTQDQPIPPAVQQKMQQLEEMLGMLSKELEAKTEIIQTDQVKAEAAFAQTQLAEQAETERSAATLQAETAAKAADLASKERIAALDNYVKLALAEMQATSKTDATMAMQHAESARTALGFAHDHAEQAADREAQADGAARDRAVHRDEAERPIADDQV